MIVGKTSRSSIAVLLLVEMEILTLAEAVGGVLLVLLNPSPHRLQEMVMAPDSRTIMPKRAVGWVAVGFAVLVVRVIVVVLAVLVEGRLDGSGNDNDVGSEMAVHVEGETRERIAVSRIACVVCWSFIVVGSF